MTILSSSCVTMSDLANTLDPKGDAAQIIPVLAISSPVLGSALIKEGNRIDGNQVNQQATKATSHKRTYNTGTEKGKTVARKVFDEAVQYEANVEVDIRQLEKEPNPEQFMKNQEADQVAAMTEDFDSCFFYGNSKIDPLDFDGLATRYNKLSTVITNKGYQVLDCGGTSNLTSLYLVGYGAKGSSIFYPLGSQAGIDRIVTPRARVTDADSKPYYAYCVNDNWQVGFTIENYRMNVRLANIDVVALATYGATGSDTAVDILKFVTLGKNRLQSKGVPLKFVWYGNEVALGYLECMINDKHNTMISRVERMGAPPELYLNGWPVLKSDNILSTETRVTA